MANPPEKKNSEQNESGDFWSRDLPAFDPITEAKTKLLKEVSVSDNEITQVDVFFDQLRELEKAITVDTIGAEKEQRRLTEIILQTLNQIEASNSTLSQKLHETYEEYIAVAAQDKLVKKQEDMESVNWAMLVIAIPEGLKILAEDHGDLPFFTNRGGVLSKDEKEELHAKLKPYHLIVLEIYRKMLALASDKEIRSGEFPSYKEYLWTSDDLPESQKALQTLLEYIQTLT